MPEESGRAPTTPLLFSGGGELGELMARFDWASTPIGPVEEWPQSLRTALSICLSSRFPILLWWGPELVMLYNDAYRSVLGSMKHPRSLGQSGRECWPEIWDTIGPMLHGVLAGEGATWSEDQLLLLERNGFAEECYFTFSYSPIRDERAEIGGVFTAVTETTVQVVGARRVGTLRELAALSARFHDPAELCQQAAAVLSRAASDFPCGAIALDDESGEPALSASWGLTEDGAAWQPWPQGTLEELSVRPWPATLASLAGELHPAEAIVCKLELGEGERGLLVAGRNPRRPWDDAFVGFAGLVADQISALLVDARARAGERERARALAQLDRAKTVFFSNISHQFRTPLTLILAPLEERLRASPEDGESRLVHRAAQRLQRLVNTLLEFSRIEAGRTEAHFAATDLARLTSDLCGMFRSVIEGAGLGYRVECDPLPELVYVDNEMWERIVFNLLSNALKFTFEGEISVRLRARADGAELSVSDTGVGIPAAELPRLFERFHRVEGVSARSLEGSGIGLALTNDLVGLHHGSIEVESVEGRGSSFHVCVPFGSAHLPPEQIRVGPARTGKLTAAAFLDEARAWLPRGEAGGEDASPPASASTARILVADDNGDMRSYLTRALRGLGAVTAVANGVAALSELRRERYDVLVCDVMMPGLSGLELVRHIRSEPETDPVSIVLVSARAGDESASEGLRAGADDYLVKPFSSGELQARVAAQIEANQRHRREHSLQSLSDDLNTLTETEEVAEVLVRHAEAFFGSASAVQVGFLAGDSAELRLMGGGAAASRLALSDDHPLCRSVRGEQQRLQPEELVVGLSVGASVEGAVWVRTPAPVTSQQRSTLGEMATRVSQALERTRTREAERRAHARAERAARRSETLRAFTERLAVAATVNEVLRALSEPTGLIEASGGGVLLVDGDSLRVAAHWGSSAEAAAELVWLPIALGSPAAAAARTGRRIMLAGPGEIAGRYPDAAEAFARARVQAAVYLPIGTVLPRDVFCWYFDSPRELDRDERVVLQTAASVAWQALERARAHDADRRIAYVLQHALLDRELPRHADVSIGAAYRPTEADTEVGGDWYDVIDLPDGALGVAVGDVVGHGLRAATAMGQLRAALRALALCERSPARVIEHLDRFALDSPGMEMTTVFYGVLEADRSRLTYARAGHVPGLIVRAEGAVEQLAAGSSPPLGAYAQAAAAESTVAFEENDLLLLCSDGLIERRREHLDDGLARLAEVAAGSDALGAQATCDHVMEHLTGAETLRDDAALLALRRLPADTRLFSTRVPAHASALAPLRQELRGFLAETPIGQTRQYDILLACGEAVANAVEHAYGEPGGTILVEILVSGEHVRLEVRDSGRWKEPLAGESRGRGISILTALAKELEISSDAGTHLRVVL